MIDAPAKELETLSRSLATKDLAARVGRLLRRFLTGIPRRPDVRGLEQIEPTRLHMPNSRLHPEVMRIEARRLL
jgi:hypothetical protein